MAVVDHWSVELVGQQFDLEDFPVWTAGADAYVTRTGDVYSLCVPASVVGSGPEHIRRFALDVLERLNGVGRLLNPSFKPLTFSAKTLGIDAQGKVISTAIEIGGGELRMKGDLLVASLNGVPQTDPREGVAIPLLEAAKRSERAQDALVILGRPNLTWAEIYLVFELVEGDVGGQMFENGWIAKAGADLLTSTANSYSTLRSSGRHGKDRGSPPRSPMAQSTAVSLVSKLVLNWLRHIANQHESSE